MAGNRKELKTNVYFADPYCTWQKGTNENLNGLLREFYPKGRNLARVSAKTLAQNVAKINNRPKKVLNFQTPADLFEQELQPKKASDREKTFTTILLPLGQKQAVCGRFGQFFRKKNFSRYRRKIRLQIYHDFANFYYHLILGLLEFA